MNKQLMSVQSIVSILAAISIACAQGSCQQNQTQALAQNATTAMRQTATSQTSPKVQSDILSKYSIEQLQQILTARSNKALYAEPPELQNIPTQTMADN